MMIFLTILTVGFPEWKKGALTGVEGKPLAPGAEQGEALDLVTQEIEDRGFIVANFESCRLGAVWVTWPMTFGPACCGSR